MHKYQPSTEIYLPKIDRYLHKTDKIYLHLDIISLQIFIFRSEAKMLAIEASERRTKDQVLTPQDNDQNR
jgi:hypothetical protein